ncbi:MAG: putative DNA modification/repair radical SAM protein [Candidatus Bathyarchaeia archaeon]|nr:putative DNA modification/repair radical SAM protein [Candidatus Bathyarchaeota archaeon A05DMB-4]MDH7594773.1 putative DNA modification/repair radical SAM protein [Candidatus Bathyarchaeota archaeon]
MTSLLKRRDKWHLLRVGAEWDQTAVPIYEAAARGKCVPLLKTLLTNHCKNECAYCAFRAKRNLQRIDWETRKLATVTLHLWKTGRISGLFLSSSVTRDPDYVMEKQLEVLRLLRGMRFTGYIHLRLMPGVSRHYICEAVELADRVGINLEAPNRSIFSQLCPDKGGLKEAVLKRLDWLVDETSKAKNTKIKPEFGFARAGIDTQMIVGAVDDNDWEHLQVTEWLYKKLMLKRVYYSGFEPIRQTPLERKPACSPSREYRLYQSSFLIKDYGFTANSFAPIVDDEGFLPDADPKLMLAKLDRDMFPLDLNTATYNEVLRIPRVGPVTAKRILKARNMRKIHYFGDLEQIVGAHLARRMRRYVELKDKTLPCFLKQTTP